MGVQVDLSVLSGLGEGAIVGQKVAMDAAIQSFIWYSSTRLNRGVRTRDLVKVRRTPF